MIDKLYNKIKDKFPCEIINGQLLINGDCLEVMKYIDDKSIDLLLTDPPFGMKFKSNHRKETHKKIENDDSLDWLPKFSRLSDLIMKEDSHKYIFCSWHFVDTFKQSFNNIKNILIWHKNNTGMGDLKGDYAPQYEMILFSGNGKKHLNGRRDSNILRFARTQNNLHPTEKPVNMFEYLINKSVENNEIVLDCFAGSFTTSIASYKTGRQSICIELDEEYYSKGVERVKKETRQLEMF